MVLFELGWRDATQLVEETPVVEPVDPFPSAGDYRLFLQFAHRDTVVTTAFTVHLSDSDLQP